MFRSVRHVLGGLAITAALGGGTTAQAQYYGGAGFGGGYGGFGGYGGGLGGWSTSAIGDAERGAGAEAAGFGAYNEETAVGTAIHTDTVMRYNQYL